MTGGEYRKETETLLMEDEVYPQGGYRPIDIRNKTESLLKIQARANEICKKKLFRKMGTACPYCGWTHS